MTSLPGTPTLATPTPTPGGTFRRRGDQALFGIAGLDQCVPLHRGELEEIAYLITLLEDWLLHAGDEVWAELADFARAGEWPTSSRIWAPNRSSCTP
ncbi:hypothetical protein ACGFIV_05495 [Sphaerisporangium sp. NPDC049003]|uniref:hypothetical protein n=1 Tax=Sphaerisporangium sp. NPDC049003 TaxID=3364517 RepID=UPI00371BE4DC